jgi:hypothetical protein
MKERETLRHILFGSSNKNVRNAGEHVVRAEEGRGAHSNLVGNPEGKSRLERHIVDGWIILQSIFKKEDGYVTCLNWFETGRCGTVVNTVINIKVHRMQGIC